MKLGFLIGTFVFLGLVIGLYALNSFQKAQPESPIIPSPTPPISTSAIARDAVPPLKYAPSVEDEHRTPHQAIQSSAKDREQIEKLVASGDSRSQTELLKR